MAMVSTAGRSDGLQRSGAQAVERALHLLHVMAGQGGRGVSLGGLAARVGLDPATVRRLLLALMRGGFVDQESGSRQYHLGLDFFSLAAAAANRFDAGGRRRRILGELSRQLRADAAFFLREGDDMVCLDAVHGPMPVAGPEMGARRPVGAEAFGLALLAVLPDGEGEMVVIRNIRRHSRQPEVAIRQLGERLRKVRRAGYAVSVDTSGEGWSLAVALLDRDGRSNAAIGAVFAGTIPRDVTGTARLVASAADRFQADLWQMPRSLDMRALPVRKDAAGFTL